MEVEEWLRANGYQNTVLKLSKIAGSAQEAAISLNCNIGQIAKSLIFKAKNSEKALLVVTSGSNRVDEKKLEMLMGEKVERPDAEFVKAKTGFSIGGVPPVGYKETITALIDKDLFDWKEIYAAAGHPYYVFKLTPEELVKMTGGEVVEVKLK